MPGSGVERPRAPLVLVGLGGLLGAFGVGLGAAATHAGGGALATTASGFCVMHAGTALALASVARTEGRALFIWAGLALVVGTALFAADLMAIGFAGWQPVPLAAPVGGLMMIGGWGAVVVAAVAALRRPSPEDTAKRL